MDKFRLDKSHLVRVYLVDDLDRLEQVQFEYHDPPILSFDAEVRFSPSSMTLLPVCTDSAN